MHLTGVCALIPAAGRGARFGAAENKVFAPLLGRPLIGWTLEAFANSNVIDDIVLVGSEPDIARLRMIGEQFGGGKVRGTVPGGENRQVSVLNGLRALSGPIQLQGTAEIVLIHDAARCCVTPDIIERVAQEARVEGGATAAVPVTDTLMREVGVSVDRERLWSVQTPQGFDRAQITDVHETAAQRGWTATDETQLWAQFLQSATIVTGSSENLKVTRPEDLALAEAILMRREYITRVQSETRANYPALRIGNGYDVHRFADGRKLFLGGVEFPEAKQGLLGHSDADVVLHALCDALLGAAGLGDIGVLFPPSDDRHKDRPSIEFLRVVKTRLDEVGWAVANVDVTVLAETPKIGPRVAQMKAAIAAVLMVAADQVGIKATTNEGMGFIGRGEGIAAHASALLMRR